MSDTHKATTIQPALAVISRFTVAGGAADVAQAFRERPHMVENADGFLKLDVLMPRDQPEEFWLLTYWRDEPSFQSWYKSHHYKEAHKGMPEGLQLVPGSVEIRHFDHITS